MGLPHYGITSYYGVTLASGAIAQDANRTQSVEPSEVVGEDGEYAKADPLKTKKIDVSINGVGPAGLDAVVSGTVTPATMTVIKADQNELNKGRPTFSLTAAAFTSFADSVGADTTDADGAPDADTLEIVSVTYSLAESVKVGVEVNDIVITGADGTPTNRANNKKKSTFDIKGKGDLPTDIALGTGNVGIAGLTGGKILVLKLDENQKIDDWNGWGASGNQYPAAA